MRTFPLLLLALSAAAAQAQNAAPVPGQINSHVAPSTATEANKDAKAAASNANAPAPENQPRVLDSVVAIVNGDVLLQSDVEQEQRLESLQMEPKGENTLVAAAQHLITQTLVVQRMKAQDESSLTSVTDEQVNKALDQVRKELPGCAAAHCETAAGWEKFLASRGLTPELVEQSWRQRLAILSYINLRFRSGIRVSTADAQTYYNQQLVPQYTSKHQTPPPFRKLQPRIQDVLIEQQVTKQIDDWEQTLRQEGSVQILVPAYGPSTNGDQDKSGLSGGGE